MMEWVGPRIKIKAGDDNMKAKTWTLTLESGRQGGFTLRDERGFEIENVLAIEPRGRDPYGNPIHVFEIAVNLREIEAKPQRC